MIKFHFINIFFFILFTGYSQPKVNNGYPKPSDIQLKWQEMEQIMFVHFGPATWQNHEYDDLSTPMSRVNPQKLNTDQWAEVAKSYGAKMIIFVAKHTGGFCWWQTETTTDYSVKKIPWRNGQGDVMAELSKSCKKYGLRLGIYLSPEDRYLNVGMGGVSRNLDFQETYKNIYRKQLIELLTKYGDIQEIWVDGSLVFDIKDIINKYAPNAVILQSSAATIRWVGNELGFAPYPAWNAVISADARSGNTTADHSNPDGDTWLPIETDVSLRRPNWFWNPHNAAQVLSLEQLLQIYYCSVGRGTNLLINVSPDTSGVIPSKDTFRLAEFGRELNRRFAKPIAQTSGNSNILNLTIKPEQQIDHVILMENIKYGERIREFKLEAKTDTGWLGLFNGTAIGHKLIIQFPPLKTGEVRLVITKSTEIPKIKAMEAFYTQVPKVEIPRVKDSWKLRNVGEWEFKGKKTIDLELDLSPFCKDAQAYEVAFLLNNNQRTQPKFTYDWANTGLWLDDISGDQRLKIIGKTLIFDGVNANQYLLNNEKFGDRVSFNLTGISPSIKVKVILSLPEGESNANIQAFLLRK